MTDYLYLATKNGVSVARRKNGNWHTVEKGLTAQSVTSIVVCEDLILAGTTDGIYRSVDGAETWDLANGGLTIRHIRWLACPTKRSSFALAGTEPAGIFVTRDGADHWVICPEVEKLRDAHGWYLPYSPEAGCVRGFAIEESGLKNSCVYAAVEVGGILVSNDSGETWQLVRGSDGNPDMNRELGPMIHPDVHSVTVHPSSPDLVMAATGGGLYRSTDGGMNWSCLYACYCRATWVNPADPQHIILGPADGVSRNGRIEVSQNGGQTWHPASVGLQIPWPRHMVERFVQLDEELLAVLSNGELWSTRLEKIDWHQLLKEADHITAVAIGTQSFGSAVGR
jgi:hypothetical protein